MSWLRAITVMFVFLAAFGRPVSASALVAGAPASSEARVSAFELVALASVGASAETSPGLHEGIGEAYDENASGYRFAARGTASAFGGLSRAGQFGIQPYNQLTKALKGTGLQAHHLLEQRFAGVLGQNARQMASVAVTKAEHQAFTNAWRAAIPYGQGTANATRQQVLDAARQIYSGHPELLRALGL